MRCSEKAMCAKDGVDLIGGTWKWKNFRQNGSHGLLRSLRKLLTKGSVGHKEYQMGLLRMGLKKVKQEKEGFEFKIAKFDKFAKDLEQLLGSQITNKSKKGLEEFKEPEVDKDWNFFYPANHVREVEPKKVRENNDALIIEDWVSDDEDDDEPNPKVEKKTVIPTATKKEFVTPEKPVKRSVSAHKHMAPRAVLMKTGLKSVNTASPVNTVRSVNTGRPFSTARQGDLILLGHQHVGFRDPSNPMVHHWFLTNITTLMHGADPNFKRQSDGRFVTFGGGAIWMQTLLAKLPDESQILLKILREDNMYSFDMQNNSSKDSLTYKNDATKKSHDDSSLTDNGTPDQQVNTARPEINTGNREVSTALPEVNTALLKTSMLGSLMYLTASRPDIMFAVCACATVSGFSKDIPSLRMLREYLDTLKENHLYGLWYSKDSPLELVAYTDSDYARATLDRKSTTGGCQFLANNMQCSWEMQENNCWDSKEKELGLSFRRDEDVEMILTIQGRKLLDAEIKEAVRKEILKLVLLEQHKIARDEEIARQWDEEEGQRAMSKAKLTKEIDWNDPSVIRYHALKMKLKTVAQARRNMVKYFKNQENYKISDFKGMSYNEIRLIFEKVWDFKQHIEPMDLEHRSERMKSPEKIDDEEVVDTQKEMEKKFL
ncbi:hypothetical protein Tco_0173169 [Tanacetum coccineum]